MTTQELYQSIWGGKGEPYLPVSNQAYRNLNQPFDVAPGTKEYADRANLAQESMKALSTAFIDAYHKKYNVLPDEGHVRDFVASSLNQGFAQKMIQGGVPADQLSQTAKSYISSNASDIAPISDTSVTPEGDLATRIAKLYQGQREALPGQVSEAYNPQKAQIVQDLGAQGMLTNPNSRLTLDKLEQAKQRATAEGLTTLNAQEAAGGTDLSKVMAGLKENARQFGITSGLANRQNQFAEDKYYSDVALQKQYMDMARQVGLAQADASKPGALDFANTAVGGVNSLANAWKAFKPTK